jgi:hypothetical protein
MLQQELIDEIENLLKEAAGGITIYTPDGRKLILSVFPEALYPPKSRIDHFSIDQDTPQRN